MALVCDTIASAPRAAVPCETSDSLLPPDWVTDAVPKRPFWVIPESFASPFWLTEAPTSSLRCWTSETLSLPDCVTDTIARSPFSSAGLLVFAPWKIVELLPTQIGRASCRERVCQYV